MINIKQAVERFKKTNPEMKNKEIAVLLFPKQTENRAEQKFSRWMNGHELHSMRVDQLLLVCKVLKISPNKILKWKVK